MPIEVRVVSRCERPRAASASDLSIAQVRFSSQRAFLRTLAIIVLRDVDSFEHLGRIFNALTAVKEYKEAGDDVRLIFDGAGTKWVGVLGNTEHQAHGPYESVKEKIAGACAFCSGVFGATEQVRRGASLCSTNTRATRASVA